MGKPPASSFESINAVKLIYHPKKCNQGSTLLVSLFVLLIVAGALGTYLQLTTGQNQLTYRSQTWNCAMAVVEAGLEEALAHCACNPSNMPSQGWTISAGRYYKS